MSDTERIIEAVLALGCNELSQALGNDLHDAGDISPGAATPRVRHMILLGLLVEWASDNPENQNLGIVERIGDGVYTATRYLDCDMRDELDFTDLLAAWAWVCGIEVEDV